MLLKQLSGRCSCCKDMSSEATAGLLQASEQGRLDQAEGLCGLFCSFAEGHEELLRSQTEQVESAVPQACLLRTPFAHLVCTCRGTFSDKVCWSVQSFQPQLMRSR